MINASIRKDVQAQVNSFTGVFNAGNCQYYAFCVHTNGKEIAVGMFSTSLRNLAKTGPWEYYWDRETNRIKRFKESVQ